MKKELMEILACPLCKGNLKLKITGVNRKFLLIDETESNQVVQL